MYENMSHDDAYHGGRLTYDEICWQCRLACSAVKLGARGPSAQVIRRSAMERMRHDVISALSGSHFNENDAEVAYPLLGVCLFRFKTVAFDLDRLDTLYCEY